MDSGSAGEKRDDGVVDDSERVTYGLIAALALAIMVMLLGGCSQPTSPTDLSSAGSPTIGAPSSEARLQ